MSRKFTVLAVLYCVCLIASNLFETKIFDAGVMPLTGGLLVFPVSYILNDCITEVYGFRNARFVILTAFAMNAFLVLAAQLVRVLPPAAFWDGQAHFDYVFAANLRITIASMAAFLSGSLLNALVMERMRLRNNGGGFCVRAIVSTLLGETLDSIIFFPIAFWSVGVRNMLVMMSVQIVLKTLYEFVALPLTQALVRHLGKPDA